MSDKIYVGQKTSELTSGEPLQRISRVNIVVDSDHYYTAGDDSGKTVEYYCAWGSNAMAAYILSKINTLAYVPFEAIETIIDPATEIGDMVTINGIYSMAANINWGIDGMFSADISAPDADEIDEEYPYEDRQQTLMERQQAYTRSLIRQTAEEIRLEVEGLNDEFAELSVTVEGVTIAGPGGTTLIKGSSIDTSTLNVDNINLSGAIAWGDLSSDAQNEILAAQAAADDVSSQFANVTLQYGGQTYIDGSMIYANSIYANALHLGGNLTVYSTETGNTVGGYLGYTTSANDGSAGMHMANGLAEVVVTSQGAKMDYGGRSNQIYVQSGGIGIAASGSEYYFLYGSFYSNGGASLGTTDYPWGQIYSKYTTISTSDRNAKKGIKDLPKNYLDLFYRLKPSIFKFRDGDERTHAGFIAQDVEIAMQDVGLVYNDFAGLCKDSNRYMLSYDQFDALCVAAVHDLAARVKKLEAMLN